MAEKVEKPKFKVQVNFREKSAVIFRPGMPFIADTADNTVQWLSKKSYTREEIEVIGEKPESWYTTFPKKEPTLAEATEKILSKDSP